MSATNAVFRRDRFTWLAYFMLGYFAYLQAGLGPMMPFLIDELALSYTVAGLHMTAFALGMVLGGVGGVWATARFGRRALFWGGGGGMAAGAILLAAGRHEWVTIAGVLVMGLFGTLLLVTIQATLADRHGENRAIALTESNVAASASAGLVPLFIGLFASTGIGWQGAFLMGGIAWLLATLFNFRVPLPEPSLNAETETTRSRPALPRAFWVYWAIIVVMVAAEWSVIAWSAEFMESGVGLEKALASTLMSVFFVAMVAGRFTVSRLARIMDSARLLLAALGIAFAGFLVFWLAPVPAFNVGGLFVAGLGIGSLFPLGLSTATTIAAPHSDRASARVTLAAGLAIFVAPQALGTVADITDIQSAFGLVAGLLVLAMVMLIVARRF